MSSPDDRLDVRPIIPETIPELAKLTKWTKEELWKFYRRSIQHKTVAWVLVSELSWQQQIASARAHMMGKCTYEKTTTMLGDVMMCVKHNSFSKYDVTEQSKLPCLAVDPEDSKE